VPGLIDSHVHLCFDPACHPEDWLPDVSATELFDLVAEHAAATLRASVTTVRDLGSRGDAVRAFARAQAAGVATGPRVLSSGPVITTRAGHCHYVGTEVTDLDGLGRTVDEHVAAGDQWIKVMVTGGALTRGSSPEALQFGAGELRRVVIRAAAAGVPVAAHVLTAAGGAVAVAAGARSIEHGIGLSTADLSAMGTAGQALVPVLSPSHRVLAAAPAGGGGEHAERLRRLVGTLRETTARAIGLGVPVLAGTDAGCPGVPHGSVATEIALLHELGLDPRRHSPRPRAARPGCSACPALVGSPPVPRRTSCWSTATRSPICGH
jgi:imidazolonepropionase-like amidohydrolase